jgi:hypothetical protein
MSDTPVGRFGFAALGIACIGAALLSRHQQSQSREQGGHHLPLSQDLRRSSTAVASLLAVDLPMLLSSAIVFEHAFELHGLGSATISAVQAGDVAWLMAMALAGSLTVALLQIASDLLLMRLGPFDSTLTDELVEQ